MTEKQPEELTETTALATLTRLATALDCAIEDVEVTVLDVNLQRFDLKRDVERLTRDVERLTAERDSVLLTLSKLEMEVAILQGEREAAAQEHDRLATLEAPLQTTWPFVTAADWLMMQQTVLRLREALSACRHPNSTVSPATLTAAQRESVKAQADMLKKESEKRLNTPKIRDTHYTLYQLRYKSCLISEQDWYLMLQLCRELDADVDRHRARISRLEKRLADEAAPELQAKVEELRATMNTMRESIAWKTERIGVLTDALKALDPDAAVLELTNMPNIVVTYSEPEQEQDTESKGV